jgi:ureidoglycolate lyase
VLTLTAKPLDAAAFAPFGDVLEAPAEPGRTTFDGALANLRPAAKLSLGIAHMLPTPLPLRSTTMERHRWSSQTFLPLAARRWLVVVAPHAPGGAAPDMAKAQAFVAAAEQGVTYGADVWHHPFTVLDAPARFAVATWMNGDDEDVQFVEVAPFGVQLP